MTLTNNLRVIMGQQRIDSITDLMTITKLSRNALNKLWHDKDIESVKLETLMQVCNSLKVNLSDLIEYVPEEIKEEVTVNER